MTLRQLGAGLLTLALAVARLAPVMAAEPQCPLPPSMPNYRADKPEVEPSATETFTLNKPESGGPGNVRVTGEVCRVTYRVLPGKEPATDEEIQSHYRDLYGKLGASLPFIDARNTVAHLTAGGPEIWASVRDAAAGAVTITTVRVSTSTQATGAGSKAAAKIVNPATAAELKAELDRAGRVVLDLGFTPGQAVLPATDERLVGELFQLFKENPNLILSIEGHVAQGGDPEADVQLSKNRAEALVQALTGKGVPGNQVPSTGFGSAFPLGPNGEPTDPNRTELVKK